jgi:hypothetical protein
MNKKGDLFGFLNAIERGDFSHVDGMSDEDIKAISPFVLLMWEGKSNNIARVITTNEFCNDVVFSLSKHPKLLLKLFIASGNDMGGTKWEFVKSTTTQESTIYKMIANHYQCGYNEAKDIKRLLSKDDINELKEMYSYD